MKLNYQSYGVRLDACVETFAIVEWNGEKWIAKAGLSAFSFPELLTRDDARQQLAAKLRALADKVESEPFEVVK